MTPNTPNITSVQKLTEEIREHEKQLHNIKNVIAHKILTELEKCTDMKGVERILHIKQCWSLVKDCRLKEAISYEVFTFYLREIDSLIEQTNNKGSEQAPTNGTS